MKKSITIPKIEEDLYNSIKAQAEEQQLSVSDFVSSLFEKELNETDEENKELLEKNKEISEENKELLGRIKELEYHLEENKKNCIQIQARDGEKIRQLQEQLQATEEENNSLLKINPNEINVKFDDLETKLIYYVAEKESQRLNKEITPASLLHDMFVNFSVYGEMWFFPQPTRKEINKLKEQLDNE